MINIVFWSPEYGQTGTTSNILAVSVLAALILRKKVCLTQTHFQNKSLETALLGKDMNKSILEDMGLDLLLKFSKAYAIDKNVVENAAFTLLKGLYILPGTTKLNKELFERDFITNREYIYNALGQSFDIVFTDAPAGYNEVSQELLRTADRVVVNLNQCDSLIHNYLKEYKYLDEKAVYIIGNYHCESRYNISNLMRCYPFLRKRTSTIPFDVNYMDHFGDGRVIPFFLKNTLAIREDDKTFFRHVKETLSMVLKIPGEKEEVCC